MSKPPETLPQILKYLKENCESFDAGKILILPRRATYSPYAVHIIERDQNGPRFRKLEISAFEFPIELHNFQAYFAGEGWSDKVYYQSYGCDQAPKFVLEFDNEDHFHQNMERVRKHCQGGQNVGFQRVAKPKNFRPIRSYLG